MKRGGFTLIEILFAIMLVGLAVVGLVTSNVSFTQANSAGTNLSTAEFLIEQIRELTTMEAYENLHDFDGAAFSPPINANGEDLDAFGEFTQQITVENVNNTDFENVVADHTSNFVRITVRVLLNSRGISSVSWMRAQY
ncbi:prepilin-type N-terminal cleavage/methylation domain-containing protein [Planctomycetota bacterium]